MPCSPSRRATTLAVAAACSLAAGGTAYASATTDTTISVSPRVEIVAPANSPADFPGITNVREGKPLPRRWVVVSRDVRIKRGGEVAFAALRMTCPKGTTWRSGTASDDITASVLDVKPRAARRSVLVTAAFSTREIRVGETAAGAVLALCR